MDGYQHDQWADLSKGIGCYLCGPRPANNDYRLEIAQLTISTLYLFRDQRFRGYCLLVFDPRHAISLAELGDLEYMQFMTDLRLAVRAIQRAMRPDHLNCESLGNSNPHLHWHIVPRYHDDPRWGQPIWEGWPRNEFSLNRVRLPADEEQALVRHIQLTVANENIVPY
jgi:ATP adenylyltransferase